MGLTYVFGPIVATDTLLNINLQFHRTYDKQDKVKGWGWDADGELNYSECGEGLYDVDPEAAIDDLLQSLKETLLERVAEKEVEEEERKARREANRGN